MKVIKTVNLIGLNKENTQICLVKRAYEEKNKDKWALIGESMETNENNSFAINRILMENMNCKVNNLKELKKSETRTKTTIIKSQYLIGNIVGEIKPDPRKIGEFKWFDIDSELLNLEFAFNQKMIIENFLKYINK
jgi:ADP-ribose pyrophosphatase YjhB (NUDIX family)